MVKLKEVVSYTDALYRVLDELLFFGINRYGIWIRGEIEAILSRLEVRDDQKDIMLQQLIWMLLFCYVEEPDGKTIYQHFLEEKYQESKEENVPGLKGGLQYIRPGFYHVLNAGKRTGRIFIFTDILKKESKVVYYYNHKLRVPSSGDVVTGLLIPFDDEICISINQFLHFTKPVNKEKVIAALGFMSRHEVLGLDRYVSLLEDILNAGGKR